MKRSRQRHIKTLVLSVLLHVSMTFKPTMESYALATIIQRPMQVLYLYSTSTPLMLFIYEHWSSSSLLSRPATLEHICLCFFFNVQLDFSSLCSGAQHC